MARIVVLPKSDTLGTVDVRQLMEGRGELPPIDPKTWAPTELRSFVVNQDPKMVAVPQFLSLAECQHLIDISEGNWIRSLVGKLVDENENGSKEGDTPQSRSKIQSSAATTRTSSSCMLRPAQTAILQRIENRLARLANLSVEHLERLVIVRYSPGQQFTEHHDGKFRPITVFVYLNELPEGAEGDTIFPVLGLSFVPRAGCAVMWPNAQPDGKEDSRMVHAGRPPLTGVKYGINCFFNADQKQQVQMSTVNISVEESHRVEIASLGGGGGAGNGKTFVIDSEPNLRAVPGFASFEEVDHLLELLSVVTAARECQEASTASQPFAGSTATICGLEHGQTPIVADLEARLAAWGSFSVDNLGQLKLVETGTVLGLCNRGCGQRCLILCLSAKDEVFFPHLGLRIAMSRGDLLEWPNAWFQAPSRLDASQKVTVEDLRSQRVHLRFAGEDSPTFSLETCYHDAPIRKEAIHAPPVPK
ncbi:unnamed protein product [Polarella glacialis]|uniref:Prolyl 4-hydroxylase alpha subunit domain-containing protein n=1 Tax=Polarella glacialis TaxID=89957 RepID=A0A813K5B9_POLGL|nr:unnamed protein product [Polarella glacialis]